MPISDLRGRFYESAMASLVYTRILHIHKFDEELQCFQEMLQCAQEPCVIFYHTGLSYNEFQQQLTLNRAYCLANNGFPGRIKHKKLDAVHAPKGRLHIIKQRTLQEYMTVENLFRKKQRCLRALHKLGA
jgi:hypothetical protein